ncbi:hypothetical protein [Granulicella sibirica]|uniref:Uncharacterized protein n=1 Tax=Granulicella sibirica TaxID=2479048 RepID=A0A4Q0T412_9BACT|nr:hypothetical protein [Granulicella sibirica]RXH57662.1 hypothetical protein GRAN_0972 [Granulicella sibirica]
MPQESNQRPEEIQNAAKHEGVVSAPLKTPPSEHKAAVEPSGSKGDNPSTAGPGQTAVHSTTPENALGRLNPSAPEDANVSPGSATVK